MDWFFFETGIGVIILMLHFSLDLKQLPSPTPPSPENKNNKKLFQLRLRCQSLQSVTFAEYKVAWWVVCQLTYLLTAVVGQPTRNKVKKKN